MKKTAKTERAHRPRSQAPTGLKVLTVGGAMIDTIAIIESSAIERMALLNAGASFLLLEEGRKTEALEVSTHCGGGAINAAVCYARLGHNAAVLAKLGEDRRASQIFACLDAEGISHRWALKDPVAPTGASVLVSSHDRNAAVFTFRGANTLLLPEDLADGAFDVDLVHIANLSNQAAHCFPVIIEKAKAAGARVSANPGIRQLHGHGEAFRASLPQLDILALNRREADEVVSLLDRGTPDGDGGLDFPGALAPPPLAARGLRFESRRMSVRAFCRALIASGVETVVLTDGRDGAFAATAGRLIYCEAHEAHVAGTAGAGDAFVATFSAYAAAGSAPPEVALRAAGLNAAAVLGHVDTQTGLMRKADIEAHFAGKKSIPNVIEWPL
ncbi:carbohydrate kinase family protein [Hyphomicrobium sp.]|uniref:carbohydrate kinase family protein n=1 Tax=Hyphomicrobium sp. TaxID=82 RepID=UPI0025BCBB9D|nr:carbohydrate kinase family protein [Hyphomicrobium sp.]MCC7252520.1 carbohydrate kinase family protein [Hyphomicrobium sp.]